ncbi:MAG TPA: DcaP family trimeric outer membrane transporter [Aestuariivirgaceae bacterium]|nr:DcaP family trimeric outer membrane transporter [Aestuariivirgaceae bacterium]
MTNTKWLRQALLGSVALGVMATGAQADELSDLKAQLESLQSRVNQLEQQPSTVTLPEGASFLTLTRGSAEFPNYGTKAAREASDMPADRGFTIAVTPTADLPAPVAEVVIYGYVKGDVIYDFDKDLGTSFSVGGLWSSAGNDGAHIRLHAFQSRFGINSRVDTAIGQIRTKIEGDFFGAPFASDLGEFRLRHAYGEWDITPTWTFLAGQTWRTAVLLPIGVSTVDFASSAGIGGFPRAAQVRMTYHAGPISWAVAIEAPTHTSTANWPNLSSYLQFDAPGGHQFIVTGTISDVNDTAFADRDHGSPSDIGWAVQAGANLNLADIATLTLGGIYGRGGEACVYMSQDPFCGKFIDIDKGGVNDFFADVSWGATVGLSFGLTDTTTFNVQYGLSWMENDVEFIEGHDSAFVQTVHANILWRPVQQMQLGWEVMWGQYDIDSDDDFFVGRQDDDAIRAQFGAWFFF